MHLLIELTTGLNYFSENLRVSYLLCDSITIDDLRACPDFSAFEDYVLDTLRSSLLELTKSLIDYCLELPFHISHLLFESAVH